MRVLLVERLLDNGLGSRAHPPEALGVVSPYLPHGGCAGGPRRRMVEGGIPVPAMATSPISPHLASPAELKERIEAERAGKPFLLYRDQGRAQRIAVLRDGTVQITIGRGEDADITLPWDDQASAFHAELRCVAGEWLVVDDGVSRNGTFLNRERVPGRRRLRDADELRIGQTVLVFRDPSGRRSKSTVVADVERLVPELSPAQHRVLVALCRPFGEGPAFARPATNREIAEELHLTVAAVKTHLRALFQRFAVAGLPQNEKRVELARRAFESGTVASSDLEQRIQ
jgi:pSer/pThr/pTyr-binding forkhead associated (FHA) protein